MKSDTYHCDFTPDGKRWIRNGTEKLENAWEFLTNDVAILKIYNQFAKGRIINTTTGAIIGDK